MSDVPTFEHLEQHCLFCDPGIHGQASQILLRSDNFYLFAGLGAIKDGYIIIAPYRCDDASQRIRSLSEVPADWMDELSYLRLVVAEFYRDAYGKESLTFEHGRAGACALSENDTQHCFHAHLCCYPFAPVMPKDFEPASERARIPGEVPLWEEIEGLATEPIVDFHELPARVGASPYLLVESVVVDPEKDIGSASRERWQHRIVRLGDEVRLESQYLRRLLAKQVGKSELWDWRKHPRIESASAVKAEFSKFLEKNEAKLGITWSQDCARLSLLESATASNVVGNDVVAEEFDQLWGNRLQHEALGLFMKHLNRVPADGAEHIRVLDGGCGPGNYLKAFYHHGYECIGTDVSPAMLEIARRVIDDLGELPAVAKPARRPEVDCQSAADLQFPPKSFHGIWYSAIVVHIPRAEMPRVLRQLNAILKPGGVLYLSAQLDGGTNQRVTMRREGRVFFYYGASELREMFAEAGLEILRDWQDTASVGSRGDTNTKVWRQFILRKSRAPEVGKPRSLGHLGEDGIHRRILERLSKETGTKVELGPGDDCAALTVPGNEALVVSTDPCPLPVLSMLEGEDYRRFGWFSMAIGLSDLAAMGARPLGMLLAVEAEECMPAASLDAFYEGVLEASSQFDCPILGGNVKDAKKFSCVGTALGSVMRERMLRRSAARAGQRLFVLGPSGRFWAGVLCKYEDIELGPEAMRTLLEPLRRPWPRLLEGRALADNGLSQCAMDSSDGLTACLSSIAEQSQVDLHLDMEQLIPLPEVAEVAERTGIDARKLMLSWGDWQLVCTVSTEQVQPLHAAMAALDCPAMEIGWVSEGDGHVWVHDASGRLGRLADFASTRFSSTSYFSHGLDAYIHRLRNQPLFLEEME